LKQHLLAFLWTNLHYYYETRLRSIKLTAEPAAQQDPARTRRAARDAHGQRRARRRRGTGVDRAAHTGCHARRGAARVRRGAGGPHGARAAPEGGRRDRGDVAGPAAPR